MQEQLRTWDALHLGWHMLCPRQEHGQVMRLYDVRAIEMIPGTQSPAIFQLAWACQVCEENHLGLLTQHELDVAPVTALMPVHHDLMTGQRQWAGSEAASAWQQAIRQHRWPLMLHCECETRWRIPAWPSIIQRILPAHDASSFLVTRRCPHCERLGAESFAMPDLMLLPR